MWTHGDAPVIISGRNADSKDGVQLNPRSCRMALSPVSRDDACPLRGGIVKPVLQALVLAEKVYETTFGRKIIAATFNQVFISKQDVEPPQPVEDGKIRVGAGGPGAPSAYISLTDVVDNTELDLQFVSLTHNEVLFETRITVRCHDRLSTVEIVARLPDLKFPGPGTYAFEVVCEGEIIGTHRVQAIVMPESPDGKDDDVHTK